MAGRAFPLQAASDLIELRRALAAGVTIGGAAVSTGKAMYLSQSMGGFIGPLALALDAQFSAAAMNGAGGGQFLYYLPRTPFTAANPANAPLGAVATFLGLDDKTFDRYEALLNLMQTFMEAGDAVNYARLIAREPPAGAAPRSLFFLEGDEDQWVANASTDALAVAAGCGDVRSPDAALAFPLAEVGASLLSPPVSGNLVSAGGAHVTCGIYLQHYDHFSLDECAAAQAQVGAFFSSALAGTASIAAQTNACTK